MKLPVVSRSIVSHSVRIDLGSKSKSSDELTFFVRLIEERKRIQMMIYCLSWEPILTRICFWIS